MDFSDIDRENFVDQDFDYFDCVICSDIVIQPKMCNTCDHIFCGPCIAHWTASNKYCPFKCSGKEAMKVVELPNSVKKLYGNLKVICSREGCEEVLPLKDLCYHEMDCGAEKCSTQDCQKPAKYELGGSLVCGEKCTIVNLLKKEEVSDTLLFMLIDRFTKSISYKNKNQKKILCSSVPFWSRKYVANKIKLKKNLLGAKNISRERGFKTLISSMVNFISNLRGSIKEFTTLRLKLHPGPRFQNTAK